MGRRRSALPRVPRQPVAATGAGPVPPSGATPDEEGAGLGPGPGDGHTRLRTSMKVLTWDGALAMASDQASATYLPLYGLALGATQAQLGWITAVPALLSNVLQLPAAFLTERLGGRKALYLWGGALTRALWLPVALLAFWPGPSSVLALLLLLGLRAALASVGGPAWTALVADLIPRRLRGTYFANRNVVASLAGLAATLAAGLLVRWAGVPLGYQLVLVVAGLLGLAGSVAFARLPDPDQPSPGLPALAGESARSAPTGGCAAARTRAGASGAGGQAEASGEPTAWPRREFAGFCVGSVLWNLAVTLPGPLFAVYFVQDLGGREAQWGLVSAASLVSTVLGQRYWGRLVRRRGERWVMGVAGFLVSCIPLWWWLLPAAWPALVVNFAAGFCWAGYNLAVFNLLLELTPDRRRATFVGLYNALAGLAMAAGPVAGGSLAEARDIRTVLLTSAALRLAGWLLLRSLVGGGRSRPAPLGLAGWRRARRGPAAVVVLALAWGHLAAPAEAASTPRRLADLPALVLQDTPRLYRWAWDELRVDRAPPSAPGGAPEGRSRLRWEGGAGQPWGLALGLLALSQVDGPLAEEVAGDGGAKALYRVVTQAGDWPGLAAATCLLYRYDPDGARLLADAVTLAGVSTLALKALFGRERPGAGSGGGRLRWLEAEDAYHSLPSGHTVAAFATAAILADRYPQWRSWWYAGASLVGVSRVYLRRHWPSDVAAGALLGLAVGRLVLRHSATLLTW